MVMERKRFGGIPAVEFIRGAVDMVEGMCYVLLGHVVLWVLW